MAEIWGIVLAAGASSRMKSQKMILPFNGSTVLESVLLNAGKALKDNLLTVLGSHLDNTVPLVTRAGVKYCINENYRDGMLSSVICGFGNLPAAADAALIILGDQPQIKSGIIGKITEAWQSTRKGIIIPAFNGKRGHPVLIETRFREEISRLDPGKGLKSLISGNQDEVFEVECGTSDILRDLDTYEEYMHEINLLSH